MSGDQVGMNGDEGGRGWGVRRLGERYIENKGLNCKNVQKSTKIYANLHGIRTDSGLQSCTAEARRRGEEADRKGQRLNA